MKVNDEGRPGMTPDCSAWNSAQIQAECSRNRLLIADAALFLLSRAVCVALLKPCWTLSRCETSLVMHTDTSWGVHCVLRVHEYPQQHARPPASYQFNVFSWCRGQKRGQKVCGEKKKGSPRQKQKVCKTGSTNVVSVLISLISDTLGNDLLRST
jgi:hypothetical protein